MSIITEKYQKKDIHSDRNIAGMPHTVVTLKTLNNLQKQTAILLKSFCYSDDVSMLHKFLQLYIVKSVALCNNCCMTCNPFHTLWYFFYSLLNNNSLSICCALLQNDPSSISKYLCRNLWWRINSTVSSIFEIPIFISSFIVLFINKTSAF